MMPSSKILGVETFLNKFNLEHPEHEEQEFGQTLKGPPPEGHTATLTQAFSLI